MTADMSREEIERLDRDLLDRISRGIYGDAPAPIDVRMWLRVVKHLLSEPTRLAAARAEGYREGVEAAAQWHGEKYRRHWAGGDENLAAFHLVAFQAIRALTPPPAEPAGGTAEPADWTVSDTELARDILCYLGIGSDASLEPGDRRRDRIAAMICADRERRIVKPATRITALEAENAALREVVAAVAKHVEGMDLGGSEHDHVCYRVDLRTDLLRRARALLQGGSDAG